MRTYESRSTGRRESGARWADTVTTNPHLMRSMQPNSNKQTFPDAQLTKNRHKAARGDAERSLALIQVRVE